MPNPTIRDLADLCVTARLYGDLCDECGTTPIAEEHAIISAAPEQARARRSERPDADYWLWLADQTVTAVEDYQAQLRETRAGRV